VNFALASSAGNNNLVLRYKGKLTPDSINAILRATERKLDPKKKKSATAKKVFNILVECVQNMYHHYESEGNINNEEGVAIGEVIITRNNDHIEIMTGNSTLKRNKVFLTSRLDYINSIDIEELKREYDEELRDGQFSEKGGGNLGFIDIAKKSGEKLEYGFRQLDKLHDLFSLCVKIKN
jgi:hypothetical protein